MKTAAKREAPPKIDPVPRRGRGRPRGSVGPKWAVNTYLVQTRLTPVAAEEAKRRAAVLGTSLMEWMRRVLLRELEKVA